MSEKEISVMWPISLETMRKYIYEDELNDYRIAAMFGKSPNAVRHLRKKYGITSRTQIRRQSKAETKLKWPPSAQTLERMKMVGMSDKAIGDRYGVSAPTIHALRMRYEVDYADRWLVMKTKRPWPAEESELRRLVEQRGLSAGAVSRLYGVPRSTVRRRLARLGIGEYAIHVQNSRDAAFLALQTFRYDDPYPPALLDCLDGELPRVDPRRSGASSSLAV